MSYPTITQYAKHASRHFQKLGFPPEMPSKKAHTSRAQVNAYRLTKLNGKKMNTPQGFEWHFNFMLNPKR